MDKMTINVMIVDDHQLFIDGIKAILKSSSHIKVVAEALSGEDTLRLLQNVKPHVLITDISMPGMNGDELTKLVKSRYPQINVLALSMHNNIESIDMMINAGVKGYILKNTGRKELVEAIETVAKGKNFFSSEVKESMLQRYITPDDTENNKEVAPVQEGVYLTKRERQIIKFIVEGYSNAEIAEMLHLSVFTITSHRKNIYSKTQVNNTAKLIEYVRKNNIYIV